MSEVRPAHLPGNYELYDPSSNQLSSPLCKGCWEEGGIQNSESLETTWVSVEGNTMVWWLCHGHADAMKTRGNDLKLLKREAGIIPPLGSESPF